jgi:hypothetical protein
MLCLYPSSRSPISHRSDLAQRAPDGRCGCHDLELWGVSITWLSTSPTGPALLGRAVVIAFAIDLTFAMHSEQYD